MLVVKTLCYEKARRFNCNVTTFTRPYDRYRQTDSLSEPLFIKNIQCHDRPTRPTYPRFTPMGTNNDCNRQRQSINRTTQAVKSLFWFLKTFSLERCRAIKCSCNFDVLAQFCSSACPNRTNTDFDVTKLLKP